MPDRTYTIKEIDALRSIVEDKHLWGSYSGPTKSMTSFVQLDHGRVEDEVRTLMTAGLTAKDVLAQEKSNA